MDAVSRTVRVTNVGADATDELCAAAAARRAHTAQISTSTPIPGLARSLRVFFTFHGEVRAVRIEAAKSAALIEFTNASEARSALLFGGASFLGKTLVRAAQARPPHAPAW